MSSSGAGGLIPPTRLGTGTPTAGTVLRGDGVWVPGAVTVAVHVGDAAPANPSINVIWVDTSGVA